MSITFIDGDFESKMGNCQHHCSPSCHPAQTGPDWKYGCLHPSWPSNQMRDFCPIVKCDGEISKCELKNTKFIGRYKGGLKRRLKNAKAKVDKYQAMMDELESLLSD